MTITLSACQARRCKSFIALPSNGLAAPLDCARKEVAMPAYEICVLKDDRYSAAAVHQRILLDDDAAISQGQRLAGSAPFEVWRGLDCVWGLASTRRQN